MGKKIGSVFRNLTHELIYKLALTDMFAGIAHSDKPLAGGLGI